MKTHMILGIIVSIVLVIFGIAFPIPDKFVYVSSYTGYDYSWTDDKGAEYVGGDAYNYQIEATLKSGWVSGVMTAKTICISSGVLLFFIILMADSHEKEIIKQTKLLEQVLGDKNSTTSEQHTLETESSKTEVHSETKAEKPENKATVIDHRIDTVDINESDFPSIFS